jgi:hypothetical protein
MKIIQILTQKKKIKYDKVSDLVVVNYSPLAELYPKSFSSYQDWKDFINKFNKAVSLFENYSPSKVVDKKLSLKNEPFN